MSGVKTVEELTELFGGVVRREQVLEGALIVVPLSDSEYEVKLSGDGLQDFFRALELGDHEVKSYAVRQIGRMALSQSMRKPLLEANTIHLVLEAMRSAPKPLDKTICENAASFVSNMCLSTYAHHPEAKAHAQTLVAYSDDLIEIISLAAKEHGDKSSVAHAVAYAIYMFGKFPSLTRLLLNPTCPKVAIILDYMLSQANGETEAQNSPIVKQCLEALHHLVALAIQEGETDKDLSCVLPRVARPTALRIADTLSKWHMEFHPWSWVSKPAMAQFLPRLLAEYTQQQYQISQVMVDWIRWDYERRGNPEDAQVEGSVFNVLLSFALDLAALPDSELPITIGDDGLRMAVAMVSPNRIISDKAIAQLDKVLGTRKIQGRK